MKNIKLTSEDISSRLSPRGLRLVGEYSGMINDARFLCECGHTWVTRASHVLRGGGCKKCADGKRRLSTESINDNLSDRKIKIVGEYLGALVKTNFICGFGHEWSSTPGNILSGRGCPSCAKHGFNPTKSAWEYVFTRYNYLKYGITNNLEQRLQQHRRHGEIVVVHQRYHSQGLIALEWENNIKNLHGGNFVTKDHCPDGWTETLPIDLVSKIVLFE